MRADQHKNKSSKGKITFVLILLIILTIGFIGFQVLNKDGGFKPKTKVETSTEILKSSNVIEDKDLQKLSEAMASIATLYSD